VGSSHQLGKLSEQAHQPAEKGSMFAETRICSPLVSPDTTSLLSPPPSTKKKYHFLLLQQILPTARNTNKQPKHTLLSSIPGNKGATTGTSCCTGRGNTDHGSPGHPPETQPCCRAHSTKPQNKIDP